MLLFTHFFPVSQEIWPSFGFMLLISLYSIIYLSLSLKLFFLSGSIIALLGAASMAVIFPADLPEIIGNFFRALTLLLFIHLTWQMSRSLPYIRFWFGNAALWAIAFVCIFILSLFISQLMAGGQTDKLQTLSLYQKELRSGLIYGLAVGLAFDLHRILSRLLKWNDFSKSS